MTYVCHENEKKVIMLNKYNKIINSSKELFIDNNIFNI